MEEEREREEEEEMGREGEHEEGGREKWEGKRRKGMFNFCAVPEMRS